MKLKLFLVSILALLSLVAYKTYVETKALKSIDSYDSCIVAKGSVIQESYPATCITRLKTRFVQSTQLLSQAYKSDKYSYQFNYQYIDDSSLFSKREYLDYERIDLGYFGQCSSIYVGKPSLAEIETTETIPFLYFSEINNIPIGGGKKYTYRLANNLPVEAEIKIYDHTKIGGESWTTIRSVEVGDSETSTPQSIYYLYKNSLLYVISTNDVGACSDNDQILSTFKFTN